MARPGDRRKRWNQSCVTSGMIMVLIGILLITSGGTVGYILGATALFFGAWDFRDIKTGWKMKNERPPWADRHDAIDRKHGLPTLDEWKRLRS